MHLYLNYLPTTSNDTLTEGRVTTTSFSVAFCGFSGSVPALSSSAYQNTSQFPGFTDVSTMRISFARIGPCDNLINDRGNVRVRKHFLPMDGRSTERDEHCTHAFIELDCLHDFAPAQ